MKPFLLHARAWGTFWIVLFWLWMLLVGEWNGQELVAAACAATLGASAGELARTLGGVRVRVPLRWVVKAWTTPLLIVADFGVLAYALALSLARRRVVRGEFRAKPFPAAGGCDPESTGIRAFVAFAAGLSPNAYAVDISPKHGTVLVHRLLPVAASETPA